MMTKKVAEILQRKTLEELLKMMNAHQLQIMWIEEEMIRRGGYDALA